MKKLLIILALAGTCLLSGCSKTISEGSIISEFGKKMETMESYEAYVNMKTKTGEKEMTYEITIQKSKENYKACLKNKENNTVQILLKNSDGVFVLTPTLNKSFRFQSNWPLNAYHAYILESVYAQVLLDENAAGKVTDLGYEIESKASCKYNQTISSQKIVLNSDLSVSAVYVYDVSKNIINEVTYSSITAKEFEVKEFQVDNSIEKANLEIGEGVMGTKEFSTPKEIISGCELEKAIVDDEQVVYFYTGEKEYTIVLSYAKESVAVSTNRNYDVPVLLSTTIGALTNMSLTFINDGIDYQIISNTLSDGEKISLANSLLEND